MKLTIDKYKNFIVFKDYDEETHKLLTRFVHKECIEYIKNPAPILTEGMPTYVPGHIYARQNNDKSEIRMTSSLFDDFIKYWTALNHSEELIKINDIQPMDSVDVEFVWKPGMGGFLNDLQREWCEYQLSDGHIKINNNSMGVGKGQSLHSKVKIPTGWTTMGEIKVGDVVTTPDGGTANVIGVYPQGIRPVYTFTFVDGRTCEADENHLWKVYVSGCQKSKGWREVRILTTKQLIDFSYKFPNKSIFIDLIQPDNRPPQNLEVDPYIMGVMIGDGGMTNKCYSFTNSEYPIVDYINETLPERLEFRRRKNSNKDHILSLNGCENHLRNGMKILGIHGKYSYEKCIPEKYMNGSTQQRLDLLQGLMDTDGYINTFSNCSYSTTSEILAHQVVELVRSFGWTAYVSVKLINGYTHKGVKKYGRTSYTVRIRTNKPSMLFKNSKKKLRANDNHQYSKNFRLKLSSIYYKGDEPTVCIKIDSEDHLYITDNYIVTHNTYMGLRTMVDTGKRTLITCLPKFINVWITAFDKFIDLKEGDLYVVDDKLEKLYELLEKGEISPKIILLPLTRIEVYLRDEREKDLPSLDEIYDSMKIGFRLMDEAHESIYRVYMSMLSCNVTKTLALSATLKSDNPFINKVYDWLYPMKHRYVEPNKTNHINVVAFHHRMNMHKARLRWIRRGSYSHDEFEKRIMKNDHLLDYYYEICKAVFVEYFINKYEQGMKALLFFYKVDMCAYMLNRFKKDFPDFNMGKYTGDESKSKDPDVKLSYKTNDVTFSTPGNCGTGKDIPDLALAFSGVSIASQQANLQMLGRPRPLVNYKGKFPYFVYLVCDDVPEQVRHHVKRKHLFKPLSNTISEYVSGINYN